MRGGIERSDLDAAVPHLVTVILDQDVALLQGAEAADVLELADEIDDRVDLVAEHNFLAADGQTPLFLNTQLLLLFRSIDGLLYRGTDVKRIRVHMKIPDDLLMFVT